MERGKDVRLGEMGKGSDAEHGGCAQSGTSAEIALRALYDLSRLDSVSIASLAALSPTPTMAKGALFPLHLPADEQRC